MGSTPQPERPIDVGQAQTDDPLAGLASDEVLRCHNPETGWHLYYAPERSVVRKFHAHHGFVPELVSRTEVADTVGLEGVESDPVGQGELEFPLAVAVSYYAGD